VKTSNFDPKTPIQPSCAPERHDGKTDFQVGVQLPENILCVSIVIFFPTVLTLIEVAKL
jgi:hypothetical protein